MLLFCSTELSRFARNPVLGVSDQVRHKPGCRATEDGQRLEISDLGRRGIVQGSSNKEWDFLHSLKICVRIKLKVTKIVKQHLSYSEIEPMFLGLFGCHSNWIF